MLAMSALCLSLQQMTTKSGALVEGTSEEQVMQTVATLKQECTNVLQKFGGKAAQSVGSGKAAQSVGSVADLPPARECTLVVELSGGEKAKVRKFTGGAGSVVNHLRELKIANLSDLLVQDEDDDWEVATSDSVGHMLGEARKEEQTKPILRFKLRNG